MSSRADLESYLSVSKSRVDETLDRLLPPERGVAKTVATAMRYAVLGSGKRLRPIVTLASYEACGGHGDASSVPAAALELIHTYSLIHDDLPCMDDDDLRRGQPTVHRAFGEATAILAGDALLTLAFELLALWPEGASTAERRLQAVVIVARRAGVRGMVGGQVGDLEAERRAVDAEQLSWIQRRKTGDLFSASAEIGALHAGADAARCDAFARYGSALGSAFQIADDLLDRNTPADVLGKTPGKDERAGKATSPALFGADRSRREAQALVDEAASALEQLGMLTPRLEQLAAHAVSRSH